LVAAQTRGLGVEPSSRILQFASFSFDACVFEVVMALCRGACLYFPARGSVPAGESLVETVTRHGITHATLPPAVLAALPEQVELRSVSTLIVAGDAPTSALVKRWGQGRRFINAYGPTEATVWSTQHDCQIEDCDNPPIGRPVANTRIYILNSRLEPAPVGVAGEIYIGSAGIARGYLERPRLTSERFVADPLSPEPGARLYRAGDLGRWRADGTIEFLGRNDFQVKIRGFRIELGEIQARLSEHPGVREAVVLARDSGAGDKRLVAYYTEAPVEGAAVTAEALRTHLISCLPEYMTPAAYVRLESLPLTPNGKLDRKALPEPEAEAYASRGYEAPVGEVETTLARLWAELLRLERVGRRDNFFELGGHSLLATRLVSRLRQALGVEVALADLFVKPVLADFAQTLKTATRAELPPITAIERSEKLPLSFAQQRLWFLAQMEGVSQAYHISGGLRLFGDLDRDALRRALNRILVRHEALRTTFIQIDGEPWVRRQEAATHPCVQEFEDGHLHRNGSTPHAGTQ